MRAQFFFLLALLTFPIQLNKYFDSMAALVFGIPIDYRTPALYFSDFAILSAIVIFIIERKKKLAALVSEKKGFILPILGMCLFLIINSLYSESRAISTVASLRVLEIALFSITALVLLVEKGIWQKTVVILKVSMALQSALALLQFIFQRSLGLYIFGERAFDSATPQIATVDLLGAELLRAYGTFPHPNVLAAFLFLSAVLTDQKFKLSHKNISIKSTITTNNFLSLLIVLALVVTFSKTTLILAVAYLLFSTKSLRNKLMLGATAALFLSMYFLFLTDTYINTVAERITLAQAALSIGGQAPLFGVGQNNFIVHLASLNLMSIGEVRLLQPVHNVFLLILAENGLIGFCLFLIFLFKVVEKSASPKSLFLSLAMLVYLSVDHFLWTLHQGLILLFLACVFIYNSKKKF